MARRSVAARAMVQLLDVGYNASSISHICANGFVVKLSETFFQPNAIEFSLRRASRLHQRLRPREMSSLSMCQQDKREWGVV
jgi:hypothetical protein